MGKNNRLGYEGEIGTLSFITDHYYPEWDEREEGTKVPWRRERTHLQDFGDIIGPHTSLEVKNRKSSDGSVSALLDDAEKKGIESGFRCWALVSKVPGVGKGNAGGWEAFTTVQEMFNGWGVIPRGFENDYEGFLAALPELCEQEEDMYGDPFKRAHADLSWRSRDFTGAEFPWTFEYAFIGAMSKMREARAGIMDEFDTIPWSVNRTVPLIVSRRREYRDDPSRWYVALHLHSLLRIAECIGTVPQIESDYGRPE